MTDQFTHDESVLPTALIEYDQWICWRKQERDGKPTKVPITPRSGEFASSTDEQTWTTFDDALEYAETGDADGIGFVFTADDPFVGIDLDDCRDRGTGNVDEVAQDIIDRLDSYTERSPSGTGYHVIIQGELPGERNRRGSIELYDTARFFTVTGDHVEETPTHVARRQDALVAIHREYVHDTDSDVKSESGHRGAGDEQSATNSPVEVDVDLKDEELLEKATNASNGRKFERLWNGNTVGYESQSEADMALCYLLAFWTGGDHTQMDQLFRQSGLLREKWDEVHYANGSTYGEKTIERAVANTSEFYDPDSGDESTHSHASSGTLSPDAGRDESERSRAYLTEKNRLLSDRVDELEAMLKQKNDRIDTLEAEIERLKAELADRERETNRIHKEQNVDANEGDDGSETTSVWGRTKRLFGSGSE
jgi:primase-polymerase (primpol)-like protein